jgi:isocitrate lyase
MSSNLDAEEQQYLQEVEQVKKWWSDSRWRYTRRPFTAEEIVAKRGTLKIQYPGNAQSKKLWNIVEQNFKVWSTSESLTILSDNGLEQGSKLHLWLPRPRHARHSIRFWMAMFINSFDY